MDSKKLVSLSNLIFLLLLLSLNGTSFTYCRAQPIEREEVQIRNLRREQPSNWGGDVVTDEDQYQAILERLKEEAENSVRDNPANYVADEADMEQILGLIESQSVSTPAPEMLNALSNRESSEEAELLTEQPDECPICLEDLNHGTKVRLENCHHELHKKCARKWAIMYPFRRQIYSRVSCPICRQPSSVDW